MFKAIFKVCNLKKDSFDLRYILDMFADIIISSKYLIGLSINLFYDYVSSSERSKFTFAWTVSNIYFIFLIFFIVVRILQAAYWF
jgi:hypothetical protein